MQSSFPPPVVTLVGNSLHKSNEPKANQEGIQTKSVRSCTQNIDNVLQIHVFTNSILI